MQDHPKILPSEIWFFKPLDVLMNQYKNRDSSYFCQLFQRKKTILELMQQGKIDATKYLGIVKKMYKNQGPQKKYAELDLVDFTSIHNNNSQEWFQDKVEETGIDYQDQQTFYNNNNKNSSAVKIQNQEAPKKEDNTLKASQNKQKSNQISKASTVGTVSKISKVQQKPSQSKSINEGKVFEAPPFFVVGQLISMKALDYYLQKFCQYKNVYLQLYEKKKKLVEWTQSKKINGANYKGLIQKANGSTQNLQLKDMIQTDLNMLVDLFDSDTEKWFQSIFRDSFFQFQMQTQNYEKHLKGIPVKRIDKDIDLNMSGMSLQQEDNNVDPSECLSFKAFDQFMDKNQENPILYVALYQKKIKFLQLVKKGQLNASKYKNFIKKGLASTQKQSLKVSYEMELLDIDELHQGNMNDWFVQVLDLTKGSLMLQQDKYKDLKQQAKVLEKKTILQETKVLIKSTVKKPNKIEAKTAKTDKMVAQLSFDVQKMYSLRVIDDALLQHTEDDHLFVKLFVQKQRIIDMAKNGELDAKKYLKMQQKMVGQTFCDNQSIKESINMDIQNLKLIHDQNLQQWFNQIAESAGLEYESQLERFNELKPGSSAGQNESNIVGPAQKVQKPNLSQILCFTVINKAFAVFSDDPQFIQGLKQKCQKFTNWIKQDKLSAQKYQTMCKKIEDNTKNDWLKENMKIERQLLQNQFKNNQQKWFKEVSKLLKQASKESKSYSKIISIAHDQINQSSYKGKIRYYLNHLAGYESLCQYYKKNKINPSKNELIKIYLTVARKQIDQIIQKIKEEPNFDITGYCKKLLPQINQINFHESPQKYQQKIRQYIASLQTQISNYKDYAKKIKKSANANNLENVKKKIAQCEQNIKYLEILAKNPKKLIPIPDAVEEKVQWFNMDELKLDPNEVQIVLNSVQGFQSQRLLKICFCGKQIKQFVIHPGNQKISTKIKASQSQMGQILKGQKKYVSFQLFKKGWFSDNQIGSSSLQLQFIRANTFQGICTIDSVNINYQARVKMARKPLVTQILELTLTKFPAYQHSKQVQEQFVKKYKI